MADQMELLPPYTVPVTTTPIKLCGADERRVFLRIQHQGTARVLLGDKDTQLIRFEPDYEEPFTEGAPVSELWAKASSGSQNIVVWVGRKA